MKTAFLLATLSASVVATQAQQWKVCKTHSECNNGFFCKPTDDNKFAMCQPGAPPAPGQGKQWAVCKTNDECKEGLFCRPTNDGKFAMCQPKPKMDAEQQWKVCKTHSDCNQGFFCKPTDDGKFAMCQPGQAPSTDKPAPGGGQQWATCTKNGDCGKGLFCKPTNDGKFSMCQPNEGCANVWQQCAGKAYSGPSCCGNGNACKFVNEWYSQCVPGSHAMESEASCTNVSVEGDATYCIEGAICGGAGDKCPKKGDVAVADCIKTLTSYVDGAKCVAPADATCQTIKTGAKGCVFGAASTSTTGAPTTGAPAATTAAPATNATTVVPTTGAPATNGTTEAPAKSGQCAESHSQCNGQNWPFGVCCKDPAFECNKKNDYLSLCEPKKQAKDVQAVEIEAWQQCGGKDWTAPGYPRCYTGLRCTYINEWYSQCQPGEQANTIPTWGQCGGNGFSTKQECRMEDECQKQSDWYSQCRPRYQQMAGQGAEVAVWQQCGGNGYNGDKNCAANTKCVKINDWYSQCQPDNTPATDKQFPTWAQCGGKNNNFNANGKTCRDADKCEHYNEWFWQCIPK